MELEQIDDDSDEGYDGLEKSLDLKDLTVEVSTEAHLLRAPMQRPCKAD